MSVFDYSRIMQDRTSAPRKPYCLVLDNDQLVMTPPMSEVEADALSGRGYFLGESDTQRGDVNAYAKIDRVCDPQELVTVYRGKDGMHMLLDDESVNPDFSIEEKQIKLYEMFAYNEYDSGSPYVFDKYELESKYQSLVDKYGLPEESIVDEKLESQEQAVLNTDLNTSPDDQEDHAPVVELDDTVFGEEEEDTQPSAQESAGVVLSSDIDQNLVERQDRSVVLQNVSTHQVYKTKNPDVVSVVVHDASLRPGRFSMICYRSDLTQHLDENGQPVGWDVNLGDPDKARNVSIKSNDGYKNVMRRADEIACAYENTSSNHRDFRLAYLNGIESSRIQPVPGSRMVTVSVPFNGSEDGTAKLNIDTFYAKKGYNDTFNIRLNGLGTQRLSVVRNGEPIDIEMSTKQLIEEYDKSKLLETELSTGSNANKTVESGTKQNQNRSTERALPDMTFADTDVMSMDAGFGL